MAIFAFASASGSPGVTTTAVALSLLWPRPVLLVEADPTGGSGILAGYFRGTRPYDGGLIELALSPLDVAEALPQHVRRIDGTQMSLLAGIRSHVQAGALRDLWEPLTNALAGLHEHGQDVIVDAGRLGLHSSPAPLLAAADTSLLVTRSTLPALAVARSWSEKIVQERQWLHPGVIVVGEGDPYRGAEIVKALGMPVRSTLAHDPESAAVFSRGASASRKFESRPLMRSLRATVDGLTTGAVTTRAIDVEVAG